MACCCNFPLLLKVNTAVHRWSGVGRGLCTKHGRTFFLWLKTLPTNTHYPEMMTCCVFRWFSTYTVSQHTLNGCRVVGTPLGWLPCVSSVIFTTNLSHGCVPVAWRLKKLVFERYHATCPRFQDNGRPERRISAPASRMHVAARSQRRWISFPADIGVRQARGFLGGSWCHSCCIGRRVVARWCGDWRSRSKRTLPSPAFLEARVSWWFSRA